MNRSRFAIFTLLVPLALSGCESAGDAARERGLLDQETAPRLEHTGAAAEPVDFRVLRELLPESLAELPRQSARGERRGALGVSVSRATAEYHAADAEPAPGGRAGTITITDLGGLDSSARAGFAAWTIVEIDQESDSSYERTTTYGEHPAYEKFSGSRLPTSVLEVLVAERFIVEISGQALEMEQIRAALERFDLAGLEQLAAESQGGPLNP